MSENTPSSSNSRRNRSFQDLTGDDEITSTYRTMYGGPRGAAAASWTSRSTIDSPSHTSQHSTPHLSRGNSSVLPGDILGSRDFGSQRTPSSSTLSASVIASEIIEESSGRGGLVSPGFLSEKLERVSLEDEAESTLANTTTEDAVAKAEASILAARQQLLSSIANSSRGNTSVDAAPVPVPVPPSVPVPPVLPVPGASGLSEQERELLQLQQLQEQEELLLYHRNDTAGQHRTTPPPPQAPFIPSTSADASPSTPSSSSYTNDTINSASMKNTRVLIDELSPSKVHHLRTSSSMNTIINHGSNSNNNNNNNNNNGGDIGGAESNDGVAGYGIALETAHTKGMTEQSIDHAVLDASNLVRGQVSMLKTGGVREQIEAAQSLLDNLRAHGEPVQRAAHAAGAAHVLQSLVESPNEILRDVCTAALARVCMYSPACNDLLTSDSNAADYLVGAAMKGIIRGKESSKDLFVTLASANNSQIMAASAHRKLIRVFTDALSVDDSNALPGSKFASLQSLDALCSIDPGPNLRKLAWSGGLIPLVPLMTTPPFTPALAPTPDSPSSPSSSPPAADTAMRLLLHTLSQDGRYADTLCTPSIIEALSSLVADPDVPLSLQAGAARILAFISALPSKKESATRALTDGALPRACEVLHDADATWSEGTPRSYRVPTSPMHAMDALQRRSRGNNNNGDDFSREKKDSNTDDGDDPFENEIAHVQVHAACAALIANLATASQVCCHVIIFHHPQLLQTLVSVLIGSHQYALADRLLKAVGRYALKPAIESY